MKAVVGIVISFLVVTRSFASGVSAKVPLPEEFAPYNPNLMTINFIEQIKASGSAAVSEESGYSLIKFPLAHPQPRNCRVTYKNGDFWGGCEIDAPGASLFWSVKNSLFTQKEAISYFWLPAITVENVSSPKRSNFAQGETDGFGQKKVDLTSSNYVPSLFDEKAGDKVCKITGYSEMYRIHSRFLRYRMSRADLGFIQTADGYLLPPWLFRLSFDERYDIMDEDAPARCGNETLRQNALGFFAGFLHGSVPYQRPRCGGSVAFLTKPSNSQVPDIYFKRSEFNPDTKREEWQAVPYNGKIISVDDNGNFYVTTSDRYLGVLACK